MYRGKRERAYMIDLCKLFDFRGLFSPIRSFYWPCTRFERWKQNICLVFINPHPKELMDGHLILTRHGLRSSEWRGCWSREGALRAPALHFGLELRQFSIKTDAPLVEPRSVYELYSRFRVLRVVALRLSSALEDAATPPRGS